MRGDVRGWRWRKPGGRERSREPGLDAACGGHVAGAGLLPKTPSRLWRGSGDLGERDPSLLTGAGGSSEAWSPAEGPGGEAGFYTGNRASVGGDGTNQGAI